MLVPATLLTLAGLGVDDVWVVVPCLVGAWLVFLYICARHRGTVKWRAITALAITVTLGALGLRLYANHHHDESDPEQADLGINPQEVIMSWGSSPQLDYVEMVANGSKLQRFKSRYRLAAICFKYDGKSDYLDLETILKSNPYDIRTGPIEILIPVTFEFKKELFYGGKGSNYVLLLVPNQVTTSQFRTLRQAYALGIKRIGGTSGPP